MNKSSVFAKIASQLKIKISSEDFFNRAKRNVTDFSRDRKLSFSDYIFLLLKCNKRSLQSGLNAFCREAKNSYLEYSKQAFSKGRERIRPEAIKELFEDTVIEFYKNAKYKTMKGYRLLAIDGTDYNLPNNEQLLEEFGSETFAQNIIQVQAFGSCLYDVLNNYLLDVTIDKFDVNERTYAKLHLEKLVEIRTSKELVLFDRGYPSIGLLTFLEENNIKYLMRCNKNNFFREIRDFSGSDGFVVRPLKDGKELNIRVVCYENENTFITNLGVEEFSKDELYDLYHKRWAIETKYNDIKNKMAIENFSGTSLNAIYQDFWATMTLSNLLSALEFDASKELERKGKKQSKLREKKINRATVINSLKDDFFTIFYQPSKQKRNSIILIIIKRLSKSLVDIVPDRHFKREICRLRRPYFRNSKSLS